MVIDDDKTITFRLINDSAYTINTPGDITGTIVNVDSDTGSTGF